MGASRPGIGEWARRFLLKFRFAFSGSLAVAGILLMYLGALKPESWLWHLLGQIGSFAAAVVAVSFLCVESLSAALSQWRAIGRRLYDRVGAWQSHMARQVSEEAAGELQRITYSTLDELDGAAHELSDAIEHEMAQQGLEAE